MNIESKTTCLRPKQNTRRLKNCSVNIWLRNILLPYISIYVIGYCLGWYIILYSDVFRINTRVSHTVMHACIHILPYICIYYRLIVNSQSRPSILNMGVKIISIYCNIFCEYCSNRGAR